MSKRSINKENPLKQKEDIENKIIILQRTLKGIEKSLSKLEENKEIADKSVDCSAE